MLNLQQKRSYLLKLRMNTISFTKMHGLGNDYIYIHCPHGAPRFFPQLSIDMSPRHTGVGSDGIITIEPSQHADFKMRIFNADGSEARMCGNGIRCVGKYVYDKHLTRKKNLTIETASGIRTLELHINETTDMVDSATADMGEPQTAPALVPIAGTNPFIDAPVNTSIGVLNLTAVSMGNPHGVIFVHDFNEIDINTIGPELEHHHMWPDRANIELARILTPQLIEMRVWERGSGQTMACGTGACATAVAAALTGRADRNVTVRLLGGELKIEWRSNNHIYMTGPATTVFEGNYIYPSPTNHPTSTK